MSFLPHRMYQLSRGRECLDVVTPVFGDEGILDVLKSRVRIRIGYSYA